MKTKKTAPVWLFLHFHVTPETRRGFVRALLRAGYFRFDTSTYCRPTAPAKVADAMSEIESITPCAATVNVMTLTDKQWTDTRVFIGKDKS